LNGFVLEAGVIDTDAGFNRKFLNRTDLRTCNNRVALGSFRAGALKIGFDPCVWKFRWSGELALFCGFCWMGDAPSHAVMRVDALWRS
jgi:hypothetical protein